MTREHTLLLLFAATVFLARSANAQDGRQHRDNKLVAKIDQGELRERPVAALVVLIPQGHDSKLQPNRQIHAKRLTLSKNGIHPTLTYVLRDQPLRIENKTDSFHLIGVEPIMNDTQSFNLRSGQVREIKFTKSEVRPIRVVCRVHGSTSWIIRSDSTYAGFMDKTGAVTIDDVQTGLNEMRVYVSYGPKSCIGPRVRMIDIHAGSNAIKIDVGERNSHRDH